MSSAQDYQTSLAFGPTLTLADLRHLVGLDPHRWLLSSLQVLPGQDGFFIALSLFDVEDDSGAETGLMPDLRVFYLASTKSPLPRVFKSHASCLSAFEQVAKIFDTSLDAFLYTL